MLTFPIKDNPYGYNLMYLYIGLSMGGIYIENSLPLSLSGTRKQ